MAGETRSNASVHPPVPGLSSPGGHYSHVTVANGFVFVSGQLPVTAAGVKLTDSPFAEQAQQVLALSAEPTPFPLFPVLAKMLTVHGYQYKEIVGDAERLEKAKRFILDGLTSGKLRPTIDRTFTLDQIVDAHRYLESNQQFGKIVVTV
ncbi:endoribonuclease L-PSP [Trinickia symbiotica]|uniref:Uncharacterized protein n=1 Tax=Trinickia symbiotica TaxID=863227 RepID=A0A2N7X5W1_9BURK|nr:zinc-binding dehydrogenase [Trinickia symbiotica]PMS37014.1 hypothetical protein C0Z20_09810 [Trinickia symbiotica]PPK41526.1 endoribonuclease L-PSP [Trinickia symbiotica]